MLVDAVMDGKVAQGDLIGNGGVRAGSSGGVFGPSMTSSAKS